MVSEWQRIGTLRINGDEFPLYYENRNRVPYYHILLDDTFCVTLSRNGIFLRRIGSRGVCVSRDEEDIDAAIDVFLRAVRALRALKYEGYGV